MKKFLPLLALILLLAAAEAHAQTYDLRFISAVRGDSLALHVQMRTDSEQSPLGTSNLPFTFDPAALAFPEKPVYGVDYRYADFHKSVDPQHYDTSNVTVTGNLISANILPRSVTGQDAAEDVGTAFRDVVVVYFKILNPAATAQFTWDLDNLKVFDAIAPTTKMWTVGTLENMTDVSLPVELVDFTAKADGAGVQLAWTTTAETNNAGFEVQYAAADSSRFRTAGFVEGSGTTTEARAYAFQFRTEGLGTYRVRLKQVDFDGAFSYSPEVQVSVSQITGAEDGRPAVYALSQATPNPFHDASTLTLQIVTGQQVKAVLYNALGQQVQTVLDGYVAGGSTRRLAVEGAALSPGLYVLQVTGEKFSDSRQLVLVR